MTQFLSAELSTCGWVHRKSEYSKCDECQNRSIKGHWSIRERAMCPPRGQGSLLRKRVGIRVHWAKMGKVRSLGFSLTYIPIRLRKVPCSQRCSTNNCKTTGWMNKKASFSCCLILLPPPNYIFPHTLFKPRGNLCFITHPFPCLVFCKPLKSLLYDCSTNTGVLGDAYRIEIMREAWHKWAFPTNFPLENVNAESGENSMCCVVIVIAMPCHTWQRGTSGRLRSTSTYMLLSGTRGAEANTSCVPSPSHRKERRPYRNLEKRDLQTMPQLPAM